jgi:hypothetical protein
MAPRKKYGLEAGEGGLAMGGGLAVHRLRALPRPRQGQNEHTQHANNHHLQLGLAQHFFGTCRESMKTPFTTNVAHSMSFWDVAVLKNKKPIFFIFWL